MRKPINKKIKVLYFVDSLEYGGIQKFLLNIIKNNKNMDIDILTIKEEPTSIEKEITLNKVNVYKLNNSKIKGIFSYINYKKQVDLFFKYHHDYDVVHMNGTSKNSYILKCAKKNNIKMRIAHSHNTDFITKNKLKKIIGNYLKKELIKYSTDLFACSESAGRWLFKDNDFIVIPNGIETKKYLYNKLYREELIKKYNLENKFIIGNIARITNQKNTLFLIDILKELLKVKDNVFLIIIGTGNLEKKLQRKIKNNNLENNVLVLKNIDDIYKYYNIFDVFVLPSLYEGFSISVLEAQINGLQCIVNKDVLPNEVKVSDNIIEVTKNNIEMYKKKILKSKRNNNKIQVDNYNIENVVKELEKIYQSR